MFTDLRKDLFYHLYLWRYRIDIEYSTYLQMCHVTIITYHIKRKLALLCGNWKLQQRVILFMSAY